MKIAVIVNPESGKGNGIKFFEKLKSLHANDPRIEFVLTERPLHATELAQKVSSYERIIICGGDGTLHEVINGLNLNSNPILGLIPIGSGNDFSLSFHKSKMDNISLFNYYLSEDPKIRKIDFGNVQVFEENGKEYKKRLINSFGVGFDAKVAYFNQNNKIFSGTLSYIVPILKSLFEFTKIDFTAYLDSNNISGNALFCAVGNGRSIGGGLYLMPNAKIDDNILNLSVVSIKSRIKLLALLPRAMSNSLTNLKELKQYNFHKLELELKTPFYAHIDGEIVTNKAKSIKISLADMKLNFMCKHI